MKENEQMMLLLLREQKQHLEKTMPIFLAMLAVFLETDQESPVDRTMRRNAYVAVDALRGQCSTIARLLSALGMHDEESE